MKDDIRRWIESGADVPSGLRFLALLSPNPPLARLLTLNPGKYRPLLVRKLSALAGLDTATHLVPENSPATPMRQEWPFLSSPDCPAELKILAADKITAYHNYVEAHAALFSCTSPEECFSTAKKVMENFIEKSENHFRICVLQGTPPPAGSAPCLQGTARGIEAAQTVYTPTMPAPG